MLRIVVLISGNGSNLQALIDAFDNPSFRGKITAVISNREEAYGLERARQAGIETAVLDHANYPDRESYDKALTELIDSHQPGLVVLAGFMRILTDEFVRHYSGRLLNIHPSLLPNYKGLNTHSRALEAGDTWHGASVHYVNEELDGGPVILQASIPVEQGDTPDSLAARVLKKEHIIYPMVIGWIAEGRLSLSEGRPLFDGEPLDAPLQLEQL